MAHDVFISYSSADKPVADAACAALESRGLRCWIAPRDILPGLDWGAAIIKAIEGCRVMVLVFSSSANRSRQIKREVERAVAKGLTIVPLRIENVAPGKTLEYFISTPHWLDALTPPMEKHFEELAQTVRLLLTRTTRDSMEEIPAPVPSRAFGPTPSASAPPAFPSSRPSPLLTRRALVSIALLAALLSLGILFARRGTPPEIVSLEFPASMQAGSGKTSGSLQFRDPEGDILAASFAVIEAAQFEPFVLDLRVHGQKVGRIPFSLRSSVPQRVTLEATLLDAHGRKSDPFRFSFEVQKAARKGQRGFTIETPKFKFRVP